MDNFYLRVRRMPNSTGGHELLVEQLVNYYEDYMPDDGWQPYDMDGKYSIEVIPRVKVEDAGKSLGIYVYNSAPKKLPIQAWEDYNWKAIYFYWKK